MDGRTDGQTDVPTDRRTFLPLMLLRRLGGVDLKRLTKKNVLDVVGRRTETRMIGCKMALSSRRAMQRLEMSVDRRL